MDFAAENIDSTVLFWGSRMSERVEIAVRSQ
jgi:hypothetical protein